MEVAAFVLSCVAIALSASAFGWQIWAWHRDRRFDVRVRVEPSRFVEAGKYELHVVIENHGATTEAVHEVLFVYEGDMRGVRGSGDGAQLGAPVMMDTGADGAELPPNRHVRRTYDLFAARFAPIPLEVTARVTLQSGRVVQSDPYELDEASVQMAWPPAQAGDPPPAWGAVPGSQWTD